jgi:NADH-quinone oxidoreductase subunit K
MVLSFFLLMFVSVVLFCIGSIGVVVNKKNILIVLMNIELMLLAVNLFFTSSSVFIDDLMGLVFCIFILTVAAAESSIGLALLIVYFRVRGSISMAQFQVLRG